MPDVPITIPSYLRILCLVTLIVSMSANGTELHDAVIAKDLSAINELLTGEVDIDETDFFTGTALHVAIARGDSAIVERLLDHGADIEAVSELQGARALHLAVEFEQLEILKILLERGADAATRDGEQRTALYRAASRSPMDFVELLLHHGAEVDVGEDVFGATPLEIAADNGRLEIVKMLLHNGANINAVDNRGFSALSLAAQPLSFRNVGDGRLIEFLVSQGADLYIKNSHGQTPLEYAEMRHNRTWSEIADVLRRLETSK